MIRSITPKRREVARNRLQSGFIEGRRKGCIVHALREVPPPGSHVRLGDRTHTTTECRRVRKMPSSLLQDSYFSAVWNQHSHARATSDHAQDDEGE